MERLTYERLLSSLTGFGFPKYVLDENWLDKWEIDIVRDEAINQYFYKEFIYYNKKLVYTSTYNPYHDSRYLYINNSLKWSFLLKQIYKYHKLYIYKRI